MEVNVIKRVNEPILIDTRVEWYVKYQPVVNLAVFTQQVLMPNSQFLPIFDFLNNKMTSSFKLPISDVCSHGLDLKQVICANELLYSETEVNNVAMDSNKIIIQAVAF